MHLVHIKFFSKVLLHRTIDIGYSVKLNNFSVLSLLSILSLSLFFQLYVLVTINLKYIIKIRS